jgi:hypothetical protein
LSVVHDESENWVRYNIFFTCCSANKKVYNVIIDNDAYANIVFIDMVNNLQFKIVAHPQPYKLRWLKQKHEKKVKNRCHVLFSIGKRYLDQIWCDVINMDAFHLLLGCPWQYDRKVQHNSFRNIYSFVKDGVKVILGPSKA